MAALAALAIFVSPAAAQDKVKVGVFPVSSTLPYFVAVERGFFKEQNIETEMVRLIGGPPNVAAMITNQIDASAVLVTIEGMNANIKKPGVAMYISVNSQNKTYQMEQFVARKGLEAKTVADLKGKKIMSGRGPPTSPWPRPRSRVGLKDGDYSMGQLTWAARQPMTAGTFDAGYTLEPNASTMHKLGVATTIEAGSSPTISSAIPTPTPSLAAAPSPPISSRAARCGQALPRRLGESRAADQRNPQEARKHFVKTRSRPRTWSIPCRWSLLHGEGPRAKDEAEYQKFIDFSVQAGTLTEKIDVTECLQAF